MGESDHLAPLSDGKTTPAQESWGTLTPSSTPSFLSFVLTLMLSLNPPLQ